MAWPMPVMAPVAMTTLFRNPVSIMLMILLLFGAVGGGQRHRPRGGGNQHDQAHDDGKDAGRDAEVDCRSPAR